MTDAVELDQEAKEWIKEMLHDGILTIVFEKSDGSEREMKCTLRENLIPHKELKEGVQKVRKVNDSVQAVYDLEVEGWRSFRWESIKRLSFDLVG